MHVGMSRPDPAPYQPARALILGGTGSIGRATARRLVRAGWRVDLVGRSPERVPADLVDAGVGFVAADRRDVHPMRAALGPEDRYLEAHPLPTRRI